ncbi:MAG: DUF1501 domain-containing protein [Candidatus Solibacter usitatus]|nr:DUF1501 domain-containing protein [Candidatus Solibacter usitatus]
MQTRRNRLITATPSRREFVFGGGMGLGSIALSALFAEEQARAGVLSPKAQHIPAKAKNCIFLLMEGGPSHIDTFDPKPKLAEVHMTRFQKERSKFAAAMNTGERYYVRSPFQFQRAGKMGIEINSLYREFASVVDDVCFYRGLQAESVNHPTALYHLNTGNQFGGDPAVGAWTAYGLGTVNQNLPAFVVLPDVAYPQGGAANWSNGFLPPHYQGTPLRPEGTPILDMTPPPGVTVERQRANLDLLSKLNAAHGAKHKDHEDLAARMESYELAFRMQAEMPGVVDLSKESPKTLEMYGIGGKDRDMDALGRRCLLARKLVQSGVRFVQLIVMGWDSHDYIEKAHGARIQASDRPIAALIKDLKRTGLLDETLVVWSGEFGRSPDNGIRRGGQAWGRDHNAGAMATWLAGGGVKAGTIVGATDDVGGSAVESIHPIKDFHVTMLRLLGLDDNKLRYLHAGRQKQLSQTGGAVIRELLA